MTIVYEMLKATLISTDITNASISSASANASVIVNLSCNCLRCDVMQRFTLKEDDENTGTATPTQTTSLSTSNVLSVGNVDVACQCAFNYTHDAQHASNRVHARLYDVHVEKLNDT